MPARSLLGRTSIVASQLLPKGVAANSGVKTGDTLLAVSGRPAVGLSLGEVVYMLRTGGSSVSLTVSRPGYSPDNGTSREISSDRRRCMFGTTRRISSLALYHQTPFNSAVSLSEGCSSTVYHIARTAGALLSFGIVLM